MSAGKINHRYPVVALHCSGATGVQWIGLGDLLGGPAAISTPDLIGAPSRGHWQSAGDFQLADEAEAIIAEIESFEGPAHLVGHSYGAAVALHIARARPELVRSLCLYEPAIFGLLRTSGKADRALFDAMTHLAVKIETELQAENYCRAANIVTDFWGLDGAWDALSGERQEDLKEWVPKALQDLNALMSEPNPQFIVQREHPITLMVGAETHAQTSRIGVLLAAQGENVELVMIPGAGHLEPFAKRPFVMEHILAHILRVEDC